MQTRRHFLKRSMVLPLMMGNGSILTSLASLNAQAADTSGYRALVCVFLFGGMDCHDTILPYDPASYEEFSATRESLMMSYRSLPTGSTRERNKLLPLDLKANRFGSRRFALPPELGQLHSLFERGSAAVVGNVGPLVKPINRDDYLANKSLRPRRLFSHNDQQSTWLAFEPEGSAATGWGGSFGDALAGANSNPAFSQISLSGNSIFLTGNTVSPYQIGTDGIPGIRAIDSAPAAVSGLLRNHFAAEGVERENLFERDFIDISRLSLDTNDELAAALGSANPLQTPFPASGLGQQMRAVAETIAVRSTLNAKRQIFFVGLGGFDTHSNQALDLPVLQQTLGNALAAFYSATEEMNIAEQVTAFTAADFGRTLTANGDGTDHGWGGHHFVLGGAVLGGNIYGEIPVAQLGHSQDAGNGRLIPTTSVEQFAAPLGRWFGLDDTQLNTAMPGLVNFPSGGLDFI